MNKNDLYSYITVKDDRHKVSGLDGIEIEIDWENPECAIINHFWLDPKIRGANIGTKICRKIINDLHKIKRIKYVYINIQAPTDATKMVLNKCGFNILRTKIKEEYDNPIIEAEIQF